MKTQKVTIETVNDLKAAAEMDEAFWVATSAPIDSLRVDPGLLQYDACADYSAAALGILAP